MATRQEMDAALQELRDEVSRDNDVNSSAATLIRKLLDDVQQGVNDNDLNAVREAVAAYRGQTDALAAAIANTDGTGGGETEPV